MRDERFDQIAKVLGLSDSDYRKEERLMILELTLENTALRSRLDTIAEYEGLVYGADQPIPFELTPKAEDELGKPDRVADDGTAIDLKTAGFVRFGDFPKMDPTLARMAAPPLIPDSAMSEPNPVADLERSLEKAAAAGHGQIIEPTSLEELL